MALSGSACTTTTDSASPLAAKPSRRFSRRTSPRSATEPLERAQDLEIAGAEFGRLSLSDAAVEILPPRSFKRADQESERDFGLRAAGPCCHFPELLADIRRDIQIDTLHY